jgi:molecular chaperone DnaK
MAFAVGIDLGTTNTVVAVVRDGVAATIPDPQGQRLLPSVVSFHPSGSTLVGRAALDRRLLDASNTVFSVKRLMGLPWDAPEVQAARGKLPFELQEGAHGGAVVVGRGERYSLPEISAFVLRHAKAVAEAALGEPVERAVVTVPANFNDLQRAATKTAGRLAGLEVLRILNEPTAAALAYGPPSKAQERIAVYDLGGGTFDVTMLDLAGAVFEVLATAGDTALGGDDIDLVVAERMADDLLKKHRFDARAQPAVFGRLRILAEQMKRELSLREEHTISVDDLVYGNRGSSVTSRFRMTRSELEWASLALVERTFKVCQQALEAAGTQQRELDRVILVGGATRMPMVARKVEQFFGRAPVVRINPDEVVSLGAAIQAALLDRVRQRAPGPMAHPVISEDSVVQPLPDGASIADETLALPLVGPRDKAQPGGVAPATFLPGAVSKPLVFDVPVAAGARDESREPKVAVAAPPPAPPARPRAPTLRFPYEAGASPQAPLAALPVSAVPTSVPPVIAPPVGPPRAAAPPTATSPKATQPIIAPPVIAPPIAPSPHVTPPPARRPPAPTPLLIDVTPLSLGVETAGGFCDVLIDANTPVPCDRTRSFATASDGQTSVVVRVAQGKSDRFADNTFLGELELSGIAPARRGESQIAVTFEIDADGILNVRARDIKTGLETAARIQLVGAQSEPGEIEAMQARLAAHPIAPLG